MWYLIYNALLIAASPVIFLILLAKKRCRRGLSQRLGFLPNPPPQEMGVGLESGETRSGGPVIWVHAVSLGEVVAAVPLVQELHARKPGYRIVVTTVTETGREAVEQRLAGIAEHRYAPLDFSWVVAKVIARLRPALFLCVETELWPNLLRTLAKRQVPSLLVNGRLSSRSYRGYRMIRPLIGQALRILTYCLMQSDRDVSRIRALGAVPERVLRTGNIKFDQPIPVLSGERVLSREMMLAPDEELIVAGSTHAGEEDAILSAYERLQREYPCLVLLLAPRHIERASQVESNIKAKGLPVIRRSALGSAWSSPSNDGRPRVILLDTRGELASVYQHAVLSFVGGTLAPIGGHNLLEPALWGIPVFFGPHTDHCFEVAQLLLGAGGAQRVTSGETLASGMTALLNDRSALQRMASAARTVVLENRGALERTLEIIQNVLAGFPLRGDPEPDLAARAEPQARRTRDSLVH